MKQYEIKTETGPVFREGAQSFDALKSRIETWPALALPSILGPASNSVTSDWFVTASTNRGKSSRNLWIRIDGLGNVECNNA